jgi:tripartite-type tricarboxylate transporter receptor subunit TctC
MTALPMITPGLVILSMILPTQGANAADYTGKTINLIVGSAPGGGYDTYSRVFARTYGNHLPGKPSVTVQNMPTAGGLNAANTIYNLSPKDGTAIAMFASSNALEPLLGNSLAKFDTGKFTWLGNINKDAISCGAWKNSGVTTIFDAEKREVRFGASGLGATTAQNALFAKNMLGSKIKVITGYGGTNDVKLAMQRGEVDASCGLFVSSVLGPFGPDVKSGDLKIIIQFGRKNDPAFNDAPNIYDLLKTEEDKLAADFVFLAAEITRPVTAPPGVSADVAATLRKAFDDTMVDPKFLADAQMANILVTPMNADEVSKAFESLAATPAPVLERAKMAITQN